MKVFILFSNDKVMSQLSSRCFFLFNGRTSLKLFKVVSGMYIPETTQQSRIPPLFSEERGPGGEVGARPGAGRAQPPAHPKAAQAAAWGQGVSWRGGASAHLAVTDKRCLQMVAG